MLLALAGCGRPPDAPPTASTAPASATHCPRIVSAAPNITEICCELELQECLVGRTKYCDYPPAVLRVPEIGGLDDLNAERLLGLRPELIILSGSSRAQAEKLRRLELPYISVPDVSLDDLFTAIAQIGERARRADVAARLAAGIRDKLRAAAVRCKGVPKRRVLVLTAPLRDPPAQAFIAGPGSFYADLLHLVGHENVGELADKPFTTASLEFILRADPDVIIELAPDDADRPGGDADARRVWAKVGPLQAVANRRVRVLSGPEHFVLGPRIAHTLERLCTLVAEASSD